MGPPVLRVSAPKTMPSLQHSPTIVVPVDKGGGIDIWEESRHESPELKGLVRAQGKYDCKSSHTKSIFFIMISSILRGNVEDF
jgi:hypothetical protein